MEGTEHGRLRGAISGSVINHLKQHRDSESVGEKNELLADVVALLTSPSKKVDCREPLLVREIRLRHDRMQMRNDGLHHLNQTRVAFAVCLDDLLSVLSCREFCHRVQPAVYPPSM